MKPILILLSILYISGCATSATRNDMFQNLSLQDSYALEQSLESGQEVNQKDEQGRTALHYAVEIDAPSIDVLLEAGADVNAQDNKGLTPLHIAVMHNHNMVVPLLLRGADLFLKTKKYIRCNVTTISYANSLELASKCRKNNALAEFKRYAADTRAWEATKKSRNKDGYGYYLRQFPSGIFSQQAKLALAEIHADFVASMEAKKLCAMGVMEWYYIEGKCKGKLAHGVGTAITLEGKRFEGDFRAGWRIKGKLYEDDKLTYDGQFSLGKPHGEGVCAYQGSFEECKLYNGERIGALYKQRIMFKQEMTSLKRELANLKYAVSNSAGHSSGSTSSSRYGYIGDLNSKDDFKRTTSRIQAAVDIYQALKE